MGLKHQEPPRLTCTQGWGWGVGVYKRIETRLLVKWPPRPKRQAGVPTPEPQNVTLFVHRLTQM